MRAFTRPGRNRKGLKLLKKARMHEPEEIEESLKRTAYSPYLLWLIWVIWLPFFVPAILELFQSHPTPPHLVVSLCGATLFFAIYLWATWRDAHRLLAIPAPESEIVFTWLPVIALTLLSIVLVPGNGPDWGDLFVFTSAYVAGHFPTVRALLAVAALTLLVIVFGRLGGIGWATLGQGIIFIVAAGVVTVSVMRAITASRDLRIAREEITRLAVRAERLRIARDLHDLLGHNLSLIALKSELAGRLLQVAPERAAAEISDVEKAARATLQEVREAVTSYRQPTLASELRAAQEILAAAGIDYRYEGDESMMDTLPPAVESALSWTVREGVTNVIRHSRARQCLISATRNRQIASVEIIDNGAMTGNAPDNGGIGLRGLSERVAALGGYFEAGSRDGSGFRLAVSIPLAQRRNGADETTGMSPAPKANAALSTTGERSEQL
jgi:two-component system, NarL family, sensor histidine kinase DesK